MSNKKGLSHDIIQAIRHLEITTKRLLNGAMVGDTRSAQRGTGFEFDQIREYCIGDDVRFIDWKAYARTNKLLVKEYIEERSRTVILLVDMSASHDFGSTKLTKKSLVIHVASALALVAAYGSDRVSLGVYTSEIEKYISPVSGLHHARTIMETLFNFASRYSKTCLRDSIRSLVPRNHKNCIIALVSDFIDDSLADALPFLSRKADVIAFRCSDKNESSFPPVGLVPLQDLETGNCYLYDARPYAQAFSRTVHKKIIESQDAIFRKNKIDTLDITTDRPWIGDVITFFKRRMRY